MRSTHVSLIGWENDQ
jgi:hypothetical protein